MALINSFGPHTLNTFKVYTNEVALSTLATTFKALVEVGPVEQEVFAFMTKRVDRESINHERMPVLLTDPTD